MCERVYMGQTAGLQAIGKYMEKRVKESQTPREPETRRKEGSVPSVPEKKKTERERSRMPSAICMTAGARGAPWSHLVRATTLAAFQRGTASNLHPS